MIFAEWPLSEADSVINGVKTRIVVSTFFCILAVLILAPLFASRLIKPIRELELAALEIETGNFDKRVEIRTKDELEDLGGAFNKMAQGLKRLQELKNEFVFLAAHELRTPVTAIKGYIEMFYEEEKDAANKYSSYFYPVKESSKRLQNLVNDLLEVARSESGKLQVVLNPINITEIVEECVSEIKPMAKEKSVHVSYSKTVSHIDVMADPDKLKDIVSNLLSNAVKYNKDDGSIDIYHEVSGSNLITRIRDTGFGISEEDIKKLFTKFFRASGTEKVLGTGLGLFLVKELVERMDGEIWVESKMGVGSTFSFSLHLSVIKN
jgi:signal transduction histidine kinase